MLPFNPVSYTLQIEGFKLHVTHNLRPFVNRIRYAPEVASRPERLEKDLVNAKILAGMLEDEAVQVRRAKTKITETIHDGDEVPVSEVQEDAVMTSIDRDEDDEEVESRERGSDAVERRIEKIMADLRDQGLVDVNDEKAYEAKKVCGVEFYQVPFLTSTDQFCIRP